MTSPNPLISFVVPVYNEERNIVGVFRDLHASMNQRPDISWEFICVEDGSSDKTREVIHNLIKDFPATKLIIHEKNQGWTKSVKDGIEIAKGDYIMYVGADEEFDCFEIPSFIDPLLNETNPADVVLGVRWQRNAYKLHRLFISVIYTFLLNWMFKLRVNDYNWSQVWSRELLESIEIKSKSLFMLPEIIIKAHDLDFNVKEVPSNHRGRHWGKSSLNMKIMGKALFDSFKYFFYRRSSKYDAGKRKAKSLNVKQHPAELTI